MTPIQRITAEECSVDVVAHGHSGVVCRAKLVVEGPDDIGQRQLWPEDKAASRFTCEHQ